MINGSTGMVFIAVEPHGEKSMYTFMGANEKFRLEKEDIEYIRSSQILHITGMYKEIVEEASKYANMLSLDPGTILSSFGMDDLLQILKRTHMIFLNKKEVSLLTKENVDEGAQILLDLGIPMVVVTLGRDGANLYTDEGMIHADAREVEALDATGAGDAFAAGFIASFVKGQELEDCLSFANLVASCCVEKLGAMNSPKISALNFSLNSKKI
jgi:sugar/nucleoside kinase (ribokinase family)